MPTTALERQTAKASTFIHHPERASRASRQQTLLSGANGTATFQVSWPHFSIKKVLYQKYESSKHSAHCTSQLCLVSWKRGFYNALKNGRHSNLNGIVLSTCLLMRELYDAGVVI